MPCCTLAKVGVYGATAPDEQGKNGRLKVQLQVSVLVSAAVPRPVPSLGERYRLGARE